MKTLRFIILTVASAALSLAAPVLCGSQNFGNGGGTTPGTTVVMGCPTLDAGAGNFISSVTLIRSGDAQTVLSGAPIVTISWAAPTGIAGVGGIVFTATGQSVVGGSFTVAPTSPASESVFGNFGQTLSISNSVNSTLTTGSGSLLNSGAVLLVDYTISPNQTGIPEPSTMALLGSALVGLGVIARRRR